MLSNNRVVAFILGLFFSSLLLAGGRRAKVEQVSAQMRLLSASEIREILEKFPEMVPDMFKAEVFEKGDTLSMVELFSFTEVEGIPLLKNLFPRFHFYKGLTGTLPPYPYLMAVGGNKKYSMPSGFNHLLLESGLEVTERNIIELAKAFVILAVGSEPVFGNLEWGQAARRRPRPSPKDELLSFPQITFLEGRRIKKRIADDVYNAFLKIKVGEEIQEWYFRTGYGGQFWGVSVGYPASGRFLLKYHPLPAEKKGKEGGWDTNPKIEIDTLLGGVYYEKAGDTFHYYLIVSQNAQQIRDTIRFIVSSFPPNARNVYIRAKSIDTTYARSFFFGRVFPDSNGHADTVWFPSGSLTGITEVTAGYADTSAQNPEDTYQPDTLLIPQELTLEKVITGRFHSNYPDTFTVYFTDQFFVNHKGNYFSKILLTREFLRWIISYEKYNLTGGRYT